MFPARYFEARAFNFCAIRRLIAIHRLELQFLFRLRLSGPPNSGKYAPVRHANLSRAISANRSPQEVKSVRRSSTGEPNPVARIFRAIPLCPVALIQGPNAPCLPPHRHKVSTTLPRGERGRDAMRNSGAPSRLPQVRPAHWAPRGAPRARSPRPCNDLPGPCLCPQRLK